ACLRESLRPQTSLRPHRPSPRRRRLLLRRPLPRRRRTRLARRTQPRSHVRRRLALAVQQPQRLPLSLLRTGRTPLRTRGGVGTHSHPVRVLLRFGGGIGFCCRSTALGAKGVGTHSHPRRVLLRVGVGIGFVVGGGIGYVVGAPPRCERG